MDTRKPPAEVGVDAELVRALLEEVPDLAGTNPTLVDEGWDNYTYRVGEHHAVRVPRRAVAIELLRNEQEWLSVITEGFPFAVPRVVHQGEPSTVFPWPWSVVEWVDGVSADRAPLRHEEAGRLALGLRRLHRTAPCDAPSNPVRGVPLADRADAVEARLHRFGSAELLRLWQDALASGPAIDSVWIHGDLHPRNVIVRDGLIAGVIDWGDLCAGDAATDLACAFALFDSDGREAFREAYQPAEGAWSRAIGWAVNFGTALADTGDARHVSIGEQVLRQLLDG